MSAAPQLALYHYDSCGYCRRVERVISELDVEVERRHIHLDRRFRDELVQARGRTTVPVLRIERADGTVEWLPESVDIIDYLRGLNR